MLHVVVVNELLKFVFVQEIEKKFLSVHDILLSELNKQLSGKKKSAGTFTESEKNQHVRIAIDLFIVCSHKKSGAIKQKHASLMTKNVFSTEYLKILPGKQDYVYKSTK